MTRVRLGILGLALAVFATPALYGQHPQPTEGVRFGVGGGITLPTGDYGTVDKAGWHVLGLIQFPISQSAIHLRFDALYGSTSHKAAFGSGNTKLTGATADLLYHLFVLLASADVTPSAVYGVLERRHAPRVPAGATRPSTGETP